MAEDVRRTRFASLTGSPENIVAASEEEQTVKIYSFPATADSFENQIISQHTMQIIAYRSQIGDILGRAVGELGDAAGAIGDITGDTVSGVVSGGAREAFVNSLREINQGAQRNALENRADRMASRALEGIFSFYIPTPMIFTDGNEYSDVGITSRIGDGLKAAVGAIPFIGDAFNSVTDAAGVAMSLAGLPINPKIEILFENRPQRRFQFEFLFSPESQAESEALKGAIRTLRGYAAPERQGPGGFVWRAPDTFDIIFFHNGKENVEIGRIDECVLEKIDVDYSPSGMWSTFRNGFPVQVRMNLGFRERLPIDRNNILADNF